MPWTTSVAIFTFTANCGTGNFFNETLNDGECVQCPENTYQSLLYRGECAACRPGEISNVGSTSEANCFGNYMIKKYMMKSLGFWIVRLLSIIYIKIQLSRLLFWCYLFILDPCESGETWDFDLKTCVPCGTGRYRNKLNDNICQDCPFGLSTNTETADSEELCECKTFSICTLVYRWHCPLIYFFEECNFY